MTMNETDTQMRLRRAKDALLRAREAEAAARIALNATIYDVANAKERYEALFMKEQLEEVARLNMEYRHSTK